MNSHVNLLVCVQAFFIDSGYRGLTDEPQYGKLPHLGGVWAGRTKTLVYWNPNSDDLTIYAIDKYGMRELWTVDSQGYAYTILRERNVDPKGVPKFSFIGKVNPKTQSGASTRCLPRGATLTKWRSIPKTISATDKIGKLDYVKGQITEYPVPTKGANPRRFVIDANDNVWFSGIFRRQIGHGRVENGQSDRVRIPTPFSVPYACAVGKNGIVWSSETASMRLAKFNLKTKAFQEYPIPDRLVSMKKLDFTYVVGKERIWARTI